MSPSTCDKFLLKMRKSTFTLKQSYLIARQMNTSLSNFGYDTGVCCGIRMVVNKIYTVRSGETERSLPTNGETVANSGFYRCEIYRVTG